MRIFLRQGQAQAEYQSALASASKAETPAHDEHLARLITHHLSDFEAQEHSKRALHELDLQAKLEQSLPQLADQAAQNAAERLINQALGSHFAMMDEKLSAMSIELTQLKSAPRSEAPAAAFDEQALFAKLDARLENQLEQRINDRLPALISAQADTYLASHIQASNQANDKASDEKFQSIKHELSAGIQAVADALAAQKTQATPAAPAHELPQEWMQQLLAKQDEMLEQRFNAWSAQMDHHIAESEHALFARIDEKVNALALQNAAAHIAAEKPLAHTPQKQESSNTKLALGVAALGVVLALIALFT